MLINVKKIISKKLAKFVTFLTHVRIFIFCLKIQDMFKNLFGVYN